MPNIIALWYNNELVPMRMTKEGIGLFLAKLTLKQAFSIDIV